MTLKPSCLISCSHIGPEGGSWALVGRRAGRNRRAEHACLAINRTRNKTEITSHSLPLFNNLAGQWPGKRRRWEGAVGKRTRCTADPMLVDLREALKDLARSLFDPYRPELHYMRGPGPKWHAKHDRAPLDSYDALTALVPLRRTRPSIPAIVPSSANL